MHEIEMPEDSVPDPSHAGTITATAAHDAPAPFTDTTHESIGLDDAVELSTTEMEPRPTPPHHG